MAGIKKLYNSFNPYERIIIFVLCLSGIYNLGCLFRFYQIIFPDYYNWTEVFISYHGGLVRRGLLGSLFSLFPATQYLSLFILIVFIAAYALYYFFAIKNMAATFNKFWCLLLLGSPIYFSFFYQNIGPFLRKDIFIEIAFSLLFFIYYYFNAKKISIYLSLLLTLIIYVPAFLIHELALLYTLLPCLMLFGVANSLPKKSMVAIFFIFLATASLIFLIVFMGDLQQAKLINEYWSGRLPSLNNFFERGAIQFLGSSLQTKPDFCYLTPYLENPDILKSIIKVTILCWLPLAYLFWAYNFHKIHASLFGKFTTLLFYISLPCTAVAIFNVMNDVGRVYSMCAIYLIMYLVFVLKIYRQKYGILPAHRGIELVLANPAVFLLTLFYLTGWCAYAWIPLNQDSYLNLQMWQHNFLYGLPPIAPEAI